MLVVGYHKNEQKQYVKYYYGKRGNKKAPLGKIMIKAVVKRYKTCKYKTYNMYRFVFDTDNSLELECGHNSKKGNHYGKNRCKSDGEHSHGKQRGNNAYDDSCKHKEPPKYWFRHLGFRLSAKNPYPLYYTPPNLRLRCS